jgi:hypothetical protein
VPFGLADGLHAKDFPDVPVEVLEAVRVHEPVVRRPM